MSAARNQTGVRAKVTKAGCNDLRIACHEALARVRQRPLPGWAAEIDGTSWAQILLKLVVSHPAITCAIPATGKLEHLRDNMAAGSGRQPDAALRARMAAEIG